MKISASREAMKVVISVRIVTIVSVVALFLLPARGETVVIQGDPIRKQVGNLGRSVLDYKQLRDSHKLRILELERALKQESDAASLSITLRIMKDTKWKRLRRRYCNSPRLLALVSNNL